MSKLTSEKMDIILEATGRICKVNEIAGNNGFISVRDELMTAMEKGEICFLDFKEDPIPFTLSHQAQPI